MTTFSELIADVDLIRTSDKELRLAVLGSYEAANWLDTITVIRAKLVSELEEQNSKLKSKLY
jgi:hypothetical protein